MRSTCGLFGAIAVVVALAGCSALDVLNATVSADGYRAVLARAYGSDARQQLDVYLPEPVAQGTDVSVAAPVAQGADVVLFFYGGRWQSGARADYRFVGQALAARGIVTVIPDYRLHPQVDWREFLHDGAAAYQWVEQNIARYGGNPRRIFVMGHSAGAHIGAMVAVNARLREAAGSRVAPCGFVGLAGPYDFLPIVDKDVQQVFGSANDPIETQPIYYVNGDEPPMLLLSGTADETVKPRNSARLAALVNRRGGKAEVRRYDDVGHVGILIAMASPLRHLAPTVDDTTEFVRDTLCH